LELSLKNLAFCLFLFFLTGFSFADETADYILVEKSKSLLTLFQKGKPFASFHVALGGNPIGHKQQEGDHKTPEGHYVLDAKNSNSGYTKSIHISYPNSADLARAKSQGVAPGGAVMIHGQKNGFGWAAFATQRINWTKGCIALSNSDMERVWKSITVPTHIEIKP
jgi:murein L,D-transpeptidase YafK